MMRRMMLAGLLIAFGCAETPAAARRPDGSAAHPAARAVDPRAWTELDIVPMPKNIRLTDADLALDPARIVLVIGAEAGRQSQIGADWINRRLADIGGAPLPMVAGVDVPADKTAIIIGTISDNPLIARAVADKLVDVGEKNPGERGYEIRRSADGKRIYLAGADAIGALYACVTFGELLEIQNGTPTWRAAEVRDWPDLIWLVHGENFSGSVMAPELWLEFSAIWYGDGNPTPAQIESYLRASRAFQDGLLRRKFSLLNYHRYMPGGLPFADKVKAMAVIRDGIEYGRERGIEPLIYAEKPFAGRRQLYPDLPADRARCSLDTYHDKQGEWISCRSLDDVTRATASNLAEFVKTAGLTQIGFHDSDGGGYPNPSYWESRCDVCRARWGDDYAAATIHKHGIYYDEIKKLNPDVHLHFTVYPYTIGILDREIGEREMVAQYGDTPAARALAGKYRAQYTEFWQRLHAAFPAADVTFAIREQGAPAVRAFRALTSGRGTFTWLALLSHAWRPFFSEGAAWSATFIDDPRDLFGVVAYLGGPGAGEFMPLEALAVREYSWNKDTPGAQPWAMLPAEEQWRHAEPKGEIYDLILPRLARNYFGRPAGPYITRAVSENVCLDQIYDRQRKQFTWLKDAKRMQWQADNAGRGARALDEFWAQCQAAGDWQGMDDAALRRFVIMRERLHLGMWVARARAQAMRARELAGQQDLAGAEAAIEQGLEYCRSGAADRRKLLAERPSDPILARRFEDRGGWMWRTYSAESYAAESEAYQRLESRWGGDMSIAEEFLNQVRADLPALSAAAGVPPEILLELQRSEPSAARAPAGFVFAPDAPACRAAFDTAPPITSLLAGGTQLARAHTRVRLLYDDANLYLLAMAWPAAGQTVADADTLELFLMPPALQADYVHFFMSADGRLRQQYNRKQSLAGLDVASWQSDNDWQLPGIEYQARRAAGRWQAWLKIPLAALGGAPGGAGWKINLARVAPMGAEVEASSILPASARDFHDTSVFRALTWLPCPAGAFPAPPVRLHASEFKVQTMTLPHAIASVVSFKLEVASGGVLHDVKITAEAYDGNGKMQRRQPLAAFDCLWYRWRSDGEYVVEYDQTQAKGGVLIKLTCEAGDFEQWLRFGGWEGTAETGSLYAPGRQPGTMGLRSPCYLPDRVVVADAEIPVFNGAVGTLEFWLAPARAWLAVAGGDAGRAGMDVVHTFFHYGPPRKDNPRLLNNAPLAVTYSESSGRLTVVMFNQNYAGWLAQAPVGAWPAGAWRHIAVVWDAAADQADRLRIYMQGKRISGAAAVRHPDRLPNPVTAILDASHPFGIQVGALHNGWDEMAATLSEARISRVARYHDDFQPAPQLTLDADVTLMLPLDGTLAGAGMTPAGVKYAIAATAGAVWL